MTNSIDANPIDNNPTDDARASENEGRGGAEEMDADSDRSVVPGQSGGAKTWHALHSLRCWTDNGHPDGEGGDSE